MMRMALIIASLLTGCATQVPGDPSRMTADQLSALARDKSAVISCITVATLAADTTAVYAQVDLIRKGQSVSIGADCSVTIGGEAAQ
jgi:hypothetical protein